MSKWRARFVELLLHGQESVVFSDAGYQGAAKRQDARAGVNWHIAMRPGKRRALDKADDIDALVDKIETLWLFSSTQSTASSHMS